MKKRKEKENINKKPFNNLYIIVITSLQLLSLQIQPLLTVLSHWGHFGREKSMFLPYKFLTYHNLVRSSERLK